MAVESPVGLEIIHDTRAEKALAELHGQTETTYWTDVIGSAAEACKEGEQSFKEWVLTMFGEIHAESVMVAFNEHTETEAD